MVEGFDPNDINPNTVQSNLGPENRPIETQFKSIIFDHMIVKIH